jgi:hypothetical protein
MGVLTPALAFLILTDITTFWLFLWGFRSSLLVSYRTVFVGVIFRDGLLPCGVPRISAHPQRFQSPRRSLLVTKEAGRGGAFSL